MQVYRKLHAAFPNLGAYFNHLGELLRISVSDHTPDQVHQNVRGWSPGTDIFLKLPRQFQYAANSEKPLFVFFKETQASFLLTPLLPKFLYG